MDNNQALAQHFDQEAEIRFQEQEAKLRSLTAKRWLRTDELALYLGISRGAVTMLVYRNRLSPKKVWGRNYFDREEVDRRFETAASPISLKQRRRDRWR